MKICYIAHSISGDIEDNLADLRRIIRIINLHYLDVVPLCAYYVDIVSLDDNIEEERARGIMNDTAILTSGFVDEVWLTGSRISNGMKNEVELAQQFFIPVVNMIGQL